MAKAYLEITMKIHQSKRPQATKVYFDYRGIFLEQLEGAVSKDLLVRDKDVQVLHGFDSMEHAKAYLSSEMFKNDVFTGLSPLREQDPEVRIFEVAV